MQENLDDDDDDKFPIDRFVEMCVKMTRIAIQCIFIFLFSCLVLHLLRIFFLFIKFSYSIFCF